MSVTMARQGGQVQLEQSNMGLALNMDKMAKGGCLRAPIEVPQQPIKNPRAKVWKETMQVVQFLEHNKVKAAIERHPAMVLE
jgi:hypothetical protein